MYRVFTILFLFFLSNSFASELPGGLFNINLQDELTSIEGRVGKGGGVVHIKGVSYRYYSVLGEKYKANKLFENVIVQVKEDNGLITSIIGQTKVQNSDCLASVEEYRKNIEKLYGVTFPSRNDSPYYVLSEGGRALILGCELKRESLIKLILTKT